MKAVGVLISFLVTIFFLFLVFLTYKGVETNKFNNVVSDQIKKIEAGLYFLKIHQNSHI